MLLHPQREPVAARPAATLLLLRDGAQGLEVLMTRRSERASFAPGAFVFPGGAIDESDQHFLPEAPANDGDGALVSIAAAAALREAFEELGVLLAYRADGLLADAGDLARLERTAPLAPQLARHGWRLALDQVRLLAHWTTDRDLPKRFDVPFLIAPMPPGQTPAADHAEQFEPVWVAPRDALERHRKRRFPMIFPTIRTLERMQHWVSVAQAFDAVGRGPLWRSCPRAGLLGGRDARYMESDAPYAELELVCPDGQILHALDWQHERPVPLLRHVQRLTAPNPGFMTGPGTNSYIVGSAADGFVVVDPGPADAAHVARLAACVGGSLRAIVCTHSHADHAPAARPLQAACGGTAPVLGLPSAPSARPASRFEPDRALDDGETIELGDSGWLRVLHTPGHAANHLCLALPEDGLLFSGDHVLNGSTTVVDPPDGHMGDYLRSLDKLAQACADWGLRYILPAHGHVLGPAAEAIARLKAHRLQREAKIAALLRAQPAADVDQLLPLAYDDVPPAVHPVARRSLLAHLEHLREQGLA
jgi:glyoxylase-like metal-dependent hydrolase (beta-lactamase superfamily II)/8-oxo-dGTP pyrophosphatase MutT (NUDIX family)